MKKIASILFTIFFLSLFSIEAYGQTLVDSFSDGNFTTSPTWVGDTTNWTVVTSSDVSTGATNSFTLRLNAPAVAQSEQLSTQIANWSDQQAWGFWVGRRGQAFTAANQSIIWLYANEADLESATVDGYRLVIGDDSGVDEIRLERVTNGVGTVILTSAGGTTNAITDIGYLIGVTRTDAGVFTLYTSTLPTASGTGAIATDVPNSTTLTVNQGTVTDTTFTPAANGFLGVVATHTTGAAAIVGQEYDQFYLTVAPTAVKLRDFTATEDDGLVQLQWQSGYEVNNLGYNIYRQQGRGRTRLNSSLIAGSALLAGQATRLTAGQSYQWADQPPGGAGGVQYWLEDIDINGTRTLHGPIIPQTGSVDRKALKRMRSELLGQSGRDGRNDSARIQQVEARAAKESDNAGVRSATDLAAPSIGAASASATQLQTQWALAGQPAVKIPVRKSGWYRVSQPALVAAGFNANTDVRYLQLFADGVEVPIVVTGSRGGRLGTGDAIEFYGVGLDTASSDTRTYWLVSGTANGKRVALNTKKPGLPTSLRSFPFTIERKERNIFFSALDNGDTDNFFGPVITGEPVTQSLPVRNLDSTGLQATLEVAVQGVTTESHSVRILFNGSDVGALTFTGRSRQVKTITVPGLSVLAGDNVVTLKAEGGETDVSVLDYVRLTYSHLYRADDNALRFTSQGGQAVRVDGFTSSRVRVFDVTDSGNPQEIEPRIETLGGSYAATAQPTGQGTRTLIAIADNLVGLASTARNIPSNLNQAQAGADLVIITNSAFTQGTDSLKALRQSQGLTVQTVDVEDVYDEFSFGAHSPEALKDFLARAQTSWQRAPRFVLLVGDATYDPRDYMGLGNHDFVPTKLLFATYMETASDDWIADFNNDGVPEMAVGRLPVSTLSETNELVSKIVNYTPQSSGAGALLVSDRNDGYDFEAVNAGVRAQLPEGMSVEEVNRRDNDTTTVRNQIINGINQGPSVVNYVGHGSVGLWTGAGLLSNSDADALTNGNRLPLFVMMTCLNGFFHDVAGESLSEALLKAGQGGAVAVWASSGLTEPDGQSQVDQKFFESLYGPQPLTLGEAVMRAKTATQDTDVRRTWILFGDPSMKMR